MIPLHVFQSCSYYLFSFDYNWDTVQLDLTGWFLSSNTTAPTCVGKVFCIARYEHTCDTAAHIVNVVATNHYSEVWGWSFRGFSQLFFMLPCSGFSDPSNILNRSSRLSRNLFLGNIPETACRIICPYP